MNGVWNLIPLGLIVLLCLTPESGCLVQVLYELSKGVFKPKVDGRTLRCRKELEWYRRL